MEDILAPGEQATLAFSLFCDLIVFTEFPLLILVDKQGVTGKKNVLQILLIARFSGFSVETSAFDLDC